LSQSDFDPEDVTLLLNRWRQGDSAAGESAIRLVYPQLRQIAGAQLRSCSGNITLSTTELAHEAFLRISDSKTGSWESRRHFLALAARVIRFLIVDLVRERAAEKRGAKIAFVPMELFESYGVPALDLGWDWIGVDTALSQLEAAHPDCARVVELKFFSGMSIAEIADANGSSDATVVRQWRFARSWLAERLQIAGVATA